jgi:hypothetical protein
MGVDMKIGDLVTWRNATIENSIEIEYGVIIGEHVAYRRMDRHMWVKFIVGKHSHKSRTLCKIEHLILVEDIKQNRT